MIERITLNGLKIEEGLIVRELRGSEEMRRRLYDLGLSEGTQVTCLMTSPLGDPRAYLIRGAVIALRREDAEGVVGEVIPWD